jgi:hypothetical protein
MNVENIRKTQEALLELLFSRHFSIHHFYHTGECGTTLCLAGIAAMLSTNNPSLEPLPSNLCNEFDFEETANLAFDVDEDYSLGDRIYETALSVFEINDDLAKPAIFYLSSWPPGLQDFYELAHFNIDSNFLTPSLVVFIENVLSKAGSLYYDQSLARMGTTQYRYLHYSFWKILAGYLALESFMKYGDSWVENTDHWSMGDFLRDNPEAVERFISAAKSQLIAK